MTYTEFKNKWLGKPINYDNAYGAQCMDVYRMYVKEVLLCSQSPPVVGAKDVWNTYLPEFFDRIANTTTGVPREGDIVIWGMNPYGHIAICDHASTSTLTCFEQNWAELDGSGKTELRLHGNYNNVLGWLRFKKPQGDTMTEEQKRILEFIGTRSEGEVREAFGALADSPNKDKQIQTLQARVLDLENSQKSLGDRITALESNIEADLKLITDWQSRYESANKALANANKTNIELATDRNTWKARYEKALETQLNKYTGVQLIQMGLKKLLIKK